MLAKVIEQKRTYMWFDGTMFELTELYVTSLDSLREMF